MGKAVEGEFMERKEGGAQLPSGITLGNAKKTFKEGPAAYYAMQFPYAPNSRPTVETIIIF